GVYLTLMIGPSVPIPAPLPVMEALKSVQVNSSKDRTGFQLTFTMGKTSLLQLAMLPAGYFDPIITRVVIIATMNGFPRVLMDGIVTRQEVTPSNEPGQSTLTVTGEDLSVLMDIVEIKIPYPALPVAARVALILAKYAVFGIVPVIVPPPGDAPPLPTEEIPTQTGSDRTYIRGLASQCGYVFYVEPGPAPLTSIAYFGPDVPLPFPLPALSVNMDWQTNVESLSFSLDGLAKKLVIVTILDPVTGKIPIPIPVPNVSFLHPPLGLRLTPPAKIQFPDDMANLALPEALKRIFGLMLDNADAITGNGSLNTTRYGAILKTRTVVGVRGAGPAYDGFYYVNSVTHNIKSGEYKQSFTLSRDGLISQTPVVGP
ncbi:MAG TPA: hypothetical protein VGW76_21100, partial [Pyrinomonadaceae bacterium]|nr:hypothetical protein [Pyrinomonadaceae bacterium]